MWIECGGRMNEIVGELNTVSFLVTMKEAM